MSANLREAFQRLQNVTRALTANVEQVVLGKRPQITLALVGWLTEGHLLLEDVPGVAKTMLARAMAQSVGCAFKRIQCTPDLLPTDVTGGSIYNQKKGEFEFRPGPIFSQIVLADEINRATPRTQSALLEAMAESRVTIDGVTHDLKKPFLLIATQNPIDHEGTFPLPEAQLDRFLMKFSIGYPSAEEEFNLLEKLQLKHPIESLSPVATAEDLIVCQEVVRRTFVDPKIRRYITEIVQRTRKHEDLALGGSPRASLALFRASQAVAAIRGRNFVLPDDVKKIAQPVLAHRLILKPESRLRKITSAQIVDHLLEEIPTPQIAVAQGSAP